MISENIVDKKEKSPLDRGFFCLFGKNSLRFLGISNIICSKRECFEKEKRASCEALYHIKVSKSALASTLLGYLTSDSGR